MLIFGNTGGTAARTIHILPRRRLDDNDTLADIAVSFPVYPVTDTLHYSPTYTSVYDDLISANDQIADDVETSLQYIANSNSGAALLGRLCHDDINATEPRITVTQQPNSDTETPLYVTSPTSGSSSILWDSRAIGEDSSSVTGDRCGTNSPALFLAHELQHADWALRNPLGQRLLIFLLTPYYDNMEEARVILETNRIATELGEAPRVNHRAVYVPADSPLDTNDGICSEPDVVHEQNMIPLFVSSFEADMLLREQIGALMNDTQPTLSEDVRKATQKIFANNKFFLEKFMNDTPLVTNNTNAHRTEQAELIDAAIAVAERYEGYFSLSRFS